MVCILSAIQAPLQAKLRPAMWLPGVKNLHSCNERYRKIRSLNMTKPGTAAKNNATMEMVMLGGVNGWEITELAPAICVQKVVEAVARLAETEKIFLHKVDREKNIIQIFSYTKAEWLDVVEIEFYPGHHLGTEGKVKSFSSGLLPVWVPLSFLFNSIFFFVPFYDNHFNEKRLTRIKEAMHLNNSQ